MSDESLPSPEPALSPSPPAHAPQFGRAKKSKRWLVWVGLLLFFLVAGGAAYWLFVAKKSEPAKPAATATQPQAKTALPEPQADASIKTYKSTTLNVEFSYRSDWTFKESADKQEVTLTSPRVAYATKAGQATEGVFTLKLRHGLIPEGMQTAVQNAVAVKDSEVIAYAAPTESQRHYTNLSFGGKDAQHFSFVIVSSSVAYKAGQPFGGSIDLLGDAYLFAGGYGADSAGTLAFDEVPAASFDTTVYQQAVDVIESLKVY